MPKCLLCGDAHHLYKCRVVQSAKECVKRGVRVQRDATLGKGGKPHWFWLHRELALASTLLHDLLQCEANSGNVWHSNEHADHQSSARSYPMQSDILDDIDGAQEG
jgi:hypothetical protein